MKIFNNAVKIFQMIENYEKHNIVSSGIHKRQKQDHNLIKDDFHSTVAKTFHLCIDRRNEK